MLPFAAAALLQSGPALDPIADRYRGAAPGMGLDYEPRQGYLRSLLKQLKIDPSSQVLVFSKGSLQADFISPKTPRALYFNEHTYVGWIPGAPLIEIMTVHPKYGSYFYTLPNRSSDGQTFKRETTECFRCHGGRGTDQIPALLARSEATGPSGYARPFDRTHIVTPELPLKNRWGGWYVTGSHGSQRHMGNEIAEGTDEKHFTDVEKGANVLDLRKYVDVKPYLTPHSDIVALMVMEQQMDVQNTLSRTATRVRTLLRRAGLTEDGLPDGEVRATIRRACEPLVEALLCRGEVALTSPIKGTSGFAVMYEGSAPRDTKGRSLSQLDLKTRLLKHPCSPLIYSASFDALPTAAKRETLTRMVEILSGLNEYDHLTAADRASLLEILRETKPGFPTS